MTTATLLIGCVICGGVIGWLLGFDYAINFWVDHQPEEHEPIPPRTTTIMLIDNDDQVLLQSKHTTYAMRGNDGYHRTFNLQNN